MYIELKEDNLQEVLQQNPKVMVQFGAGWCGNCRIMKPKFKKMGEESTDTMFVYVDAEKLPESRKLAEVDNLPTFAKFENATLLQQIQTNQVANLQNLYNETTTN